MNLAIPLSMPIEVHGRTCTELSFARPDGEAIRLCGCPFKIETNDKGIASSVFIAPAISAYIARLANITPEAVDRLGVDDWMECMSLIASFFMGADMRARLADTGRPIPRPN